MDIDPSKTMLTMQQLPKDMFPFMLLNCENISQSIYFSQMSDKIWAELTTATNVILKMCPSVDDQVDFSSWLTYICGLLLNCFRTFQVTID